MTTLVVKPIRLSEPGSYRERRRFIGLLKRLRDVSATNQDEALDIFDEADELLRSRLTTDDGTPVEDALDRLSANDFDRLLSAVAFEGGVGEASTAPSSAGTEGSREPSLQTG